MAETMNHRWLVTLAFCAVACLSVRADDPNAATRRALVHSIVHQLEQKTADFPILDQLQKGHYSEKGQAGNFADSFDCRVNITVHSTEPGPDKITTQAASHDKIKTGGIYTQVWASMGPQAGSYDTISPGGLKFYIYIVSHLTLLETTERYSLSSHSDGPLLVYYISTNPDDPKLKSAVQACVEHELRVSGLWPPH